MTYPVLTEMGIDNPQEITRYAIRHKSRRKDLLDIYYERKKGSLLPIRRTYEFGRAIKTVVSDSGAPVLDDTYEISPLLLSARTELDRLLITETSAQDMKLRLLNEIEELKTLVSNTNQGDTIVEKLHSIEQHLTEL